MRNDQVILAITKCGGHLGWYEGFFPFQSTWADKVAVEWITALQDGDF
jgi:predicted alpha/beta-fold hydrolase